MLNRLNFEVVGFSHTYRGGGGGDYVEIAISACLKSTLEVGGVIFGVAVVMAKRTS